MSAPRRFVFMHGSPGRPSDFSLVLAMLSRKFAGQTSAPDFAFLSRPGYPESSLAGQASITAGELRDGDWLIGYSWGAAEALILAAQSSPRVRGLILIAPYVVLDPAPSPITRLLLEAPVISHLLLSILRPKIEREFSEKTYAPLTPPASYRADVSAVMKTDFLRAAALEKDNKRIELVLASAPSTLPCLILAGSEDAVAKPYVHVATLRKALPQAEFELNSEAGHALPWTHADWLALSIVDFVQKSDSLCEVPNETRI